MKVFITGVSAGIGKMLAINLIKAGHEVWGIARRREALEELKTISQIGDRQLVVGRELTKKFETIYRGTVDEIILKLNSHKDNQLGEFVVVIGPKK